MGTITKFVHNLARSTYEGVKAKKVDASGGFLIAPANARGQLRELAGRVTLSRTPLWIDNGNFSQIRKAKPVFKPEAESLRKELKTVESALGRSVRHSRELPVPLRERYRDLARRIRRHAQDVVLSDAEAFAAQLKLNPDRLIGSEDLSMAMWLLLDLEPRYLDIKRRDYRRYNEGVARRAVEAALNLPDNLREFTWPVASALSYNTAVDAGKVFARHGIPCVSMGFGAYMADANYVDHMRMERKHIPLGRNLPARYARTVAVAVGFWKGYSEVAGHAPERFHFLGLGAPVMIPVVTLAARHTRHLTFDATSPIKDATKQGTLYIDKPATLKIKTRKIAHRLARELSHRWGCPCPFCVEFTRAHPFRYSAGHAWYRAGNPEKVLSKDLKPGGALFEAYPLLSEPRGGPLRREVNDARIGHNHWVIERIMSSLRRASREGRLETRVRNMVEAYRQNTSSTFAEALRISLELALGTL